MGAEKRTFWFPLVRLGAFFLAVVIVGNVFLHAFRSAAASVPLASEEGIDYFSRRKKRLERRFFRILERFFGTPASASTTVQEPAAGGVPSPILSGIAASESRIFPRGPAAERLGALEPSAAPFVWPAPLMAPIVTESLLPKAMGFVDWPDFRAGLVTDVYQRFGHDPLADVGDALLMGPELLIDGLSNCVGGWSGRSPLRAWEDDQSRSTTERLLDVQFALRDQRIFAVFLNQWTDRERRYLGAFEDESRASTTAFQDRTEGVDLNELGNDQRKIFWDALRRTYLSRYKMRSEEPIPEEAWVIGRWSGVDFAVLPALMAGVVYYRGLNKRVSIGPTALRVTFEPVSEFIHRRHDRAAMAALEWTVKGFPVGVIVSAGLHDGRYGMDFVGIGTSIGAVRRAVENQYDDGLR